MRFRTTLPIIASVLLVHAAAWAAPFQPTIDTPQSYAEVLKGIDELRQNIDGVECGGWQDPSTGGPKGSPPQITVTGDVPLAEITAPAQIDPGLPGRRITDPLGRATTGLGVRGAFEFPDSAFGYLSACDLRNAAIIDDDLKELGIPGVQWQWSGNPDDAVTFIPDPGRPGRIEINPYGWCLPIDGATPRLCEKLFQTLRALSGAVPRPPINTSPPTPSPFCTCPSDALFCPTARVPKYYCFDDRTFSQPVVTATCDGQACRTPDPPYFTNQLLRCEWGIPQYDSDGNYLGQIPKNVGGDWEDVTTTSFYRHYGGRFQNWRETQDPKHSIIEVRADGNTADAWKIRADCYGWYREIDPKDVVLDQGAEQCEIAILSPDDQHPRPPEWKNALPRGAQRGEVEPSLAEPPLPPRPLPAPWMADPDTGLSLPDLASLRSSASAGSTNDLLAPLSTTYRVVRQQASQTTPPLARTDTLSDDGERAFGAWWETQQRELLRLARVPTTRLLLPPRSLTGFDEKDPLYRFVQRAIVRPDGIVEVTLREGDEDVESVISSLMAAWIAPVQPVHIPVIVPRASLEELDATIAAWTGWQAREDADAAATGRASGGADAAAIITRLEQYRDRLTEVRSLRSALPIALSGALRVQSDIRNIVGDWYEQNATLLLASAARGVQRQQLVTLWREIQDLLLSTDASQLLWCSNHRYTLPLYSLLDLPRLWWGDRAPGMPRNGGYSPPDLTVLGFIDQPDLQFDFSDMRIDHSPLPLPVLRFEEVPVRIPEPPLLGATVPPITDLPPLPALPDPTLPGAPPLPQVLPPTLNAVLPPPTAATNLSSAIAMLQQFKQRIEGMRNAYERLQPSLLTPPDPAQAKGDARRLIHVENELRERVLRLFARWLPNRMVDLAGRAARLAEQGPVAASDCHEDTVCLPLPATITTSAIFQWFSPISTRDFTPLTRSLAPIFLQTGNALQNPYTLTITELRRLLPTLPLPLPSPLLPTTTP